LFDRLPFNINDLNDVILRTDNYKSIASKIIFLLDSFCEINIWKFWNCSESVVFLCFSNR